MTKQQQGKVANEFAPWDSDITKKKKTLSKLVRKTRWGRDERDVRFNLNVLSPPFSAYSLHRQLVGHLDL